MAAVEVKILKKPGLKRRPANPADPTAGWKARLAADLARHLPADAVAFALPDENGPAHFISWPSTGSADRDEGPGMRSGAGLPAIIIVHRGRALGLEICGGNLGDRQRLMFPRLRAAGMRIEVARSFGEALAHLREMGLEIAAREDLAAQVAALFRDARGQAARGGA